MTDRYKVYTKVLKVKHKELRQEQIPGIAC